MLRLTDVQSCTSGSVWQALDLLCETLGLSSNPISDRWAFFSFFCLRCFSFPGTIYRKVAFIFPFLELCLKKLSGTFNHSFISIAFAQYHLMWAGKTAKTFRSLRKNHKYFPYFEKIVILSTYRKKIITWHAVSDCKMALEGGCLKPGGTIIWKSRGYWLSRVQINENETSPFLAVELSFRVHWGRNNNKRNAFI